MRAFVLAACVAIAGSTACAAAQSQTGGDIFQLELTPTASGYTARCASGCSWQTLSFACAEDCHAVIDANGVYPLATTKQGSAAFAFQLHRMADGWQMESLGGTHWRSLGWGCGAIGCTARVTESGVSGPA
jgi:hypothetical protein